MPTLASSLTAAAALSITCIPASAATFDYDILVVSCDRSNCSKVAERTLAAGSGSKTAFQQDDFKLEIEALSVRDQEMDARVSLDFVPPFRGDAAGGWLAAASNQRVQVLVAPCTLKRGVFSPLAALASGGRTYHTWVRLAAR